METAVEAVLGESLQYVIVDDADAGAASIQYLKDRGAGRSGFIPVSVVKPFAPTAGAAGDARLLDRVRVKPGFERVAEALLGHVSVADDLAQAMDIFGRNGSLRTVVTLAGDVVSHQGIMVGGSPDKLAGILAKKKEVKDLSRNWSGWKANWRPPGGGKRQWSRTCVRPKASCSNRSKRTARRDRPKPRPKRRCTRPRKTSSTPAATWRSSSSKKNSCRGKPAIWKTRWPKRTGP